MRLFSGNTEIGTIEVVDGHTTIRLNDGSVHHWERNICQNSLMALLDKSRRKRYAKWHKAAVGRHPK